MPALRIRPDESNHQRRDVHIALRLSVGNPSPYSDTRTPIAPTIVMQKLRPLVSGLRDVKRIVVVLRPYIEPFGNQPQLSRFQPAFMARTNVEETKEGSAGPGTVD